MEKWPEKRWAEKFCGCPGWRQENFPLYFCSSLWYLYAYDCALSHDFVLANMSEQNRIIARNVTKIAYKHFVFDHRNYTSSNLSILFKPPAEPIVLAIHSLHILMLVLWSFIVYSECVFGRTNEVSTKSKPRHGMLRLAFQSPARKKSFRFRTQLRETWHRNVLFRNDFDGDRD